MKRYEKFNKLWDENKPAEQQALEMIVSDVISNTIMYIQRGIADPEEQDLLPYYDKFKGMIKWLEEEDENGE